MSGLGDLPLLIELVKAQPNLYDRAHKGYKDDDMRRKSFRHIGRSLGITETEAISKWKNLRDKYARERRKVPPSGSESSCSAQEWPWLEPMSFLAKHIRPRQSYAALKKMRTETIGSSQLWPSQQEEVIDSKDIDPLATQDTDDDMTGDSHFATLDSPPSLLCLTSDTRPKEQTSTTVNGLFGAYLGRRLDDMDRDKARRVRVRLVEVLECN